MAALAINCGGDYFFIRLAGSRHHFILPFYEVALASLVTALYLRYGKRS